MREINSDDIKEIINRNGVEVDFAVQRFRATSKEKGWSMKRTRPRDPDEIKALDAIMVADMKQAESNGTFHYDPERRIIEYAKFSRS